MQETNLMPPHAKQIETLGKVADQLKRLWVPFPDLRLVIPEFHRRIQEVYEHVDQFILKVEYLENPAPEDFRFLRDLIIELQEGIKNKHLMEECVQKKIARNAPREFITRTKHAVSTMQKILKGTKKLLKNCYDMTLTLVNFTPASMI
jgi:hypothetical protein